MHKLYTRITRFLRHTLFISFSLIASSLLLFALLEVFPSLLNSTALEEIRYFAIRMNYVPDPSLIFVYRNTGATFDQWYRGDQYSPAYGVEVPPRRFVASYDDQGFRHNSSKPPFDVAVIGDSYIEVGETDQDTFSERLKSVSGRSTLNLGRGWYGPFQYLTVLKRYAIANHPKYALFCYFDGNEIEDIQQYRRWLSDGNYYFYSDLSRLSFLRRYKMAVADTYQFLTLAFRQRWSRKDFKIHRDLAMLQLKNRKIAV